MLDQSKLAVAKQRADAKDHEAEVLENLARSLRASAKGIRRVWGIEPPSVPYSTHQPPQPR